MSTKTLDQVSRCGAFHHLIRRKATIEDTKLGGIKDLSPDLLALPLSNSGVIGEGLEKTLKDRSEKNKQLKEVLPELCPSSNTNKTTFKRPATSTVVSDWTPKRQKLDQVNVNDTFKSYTIPKRKPTSTVSRADSDKTQKSGFHNSFRGQGKQRR